MTMLIYREEINMVIVSHVQGEKMINTTLAAGLVDMLDEENRYGDRVHEMAQEMSSTTWVLLERHHIVEHRAMNVPREMADLYETFREQGGPSWTTLLTTMSDRIHDVSFRFEQDPTREPLCSDAVLETRRREQEADGMPTNDTVDCLNTTQNSNPKNRRDRMTRRRCI